MEAEGIRPGQIPSWRPGVVYWRPLDDGREICVYPLLFNQGKLAVGPIADEFGFDEGYHYRRLEDALAAAVRWDGEGEPTEWFKKDV